GNYSTDIYEQKTPLNEAIRSGAVGAITPRAPLSQLREWQRQAVEESPRGIPLLFSADIIHGYKTMFPIPLAQSCSWDLAAIERAERIAATEAAAAGLHWTFSPMVDLPRDARWGRWMESAGEDVLLTSRIGAARVRGFQGEDLADTTTILACAKHFAGYGAVEGGRDYNAVDLSERQLRQHHLPPFQAAVDAGVGTIMNAFNTVNGIPASSNRWLLTDVLRDEWGFTGFTVSDANSFYELIPHGVAADRRDAALQCFRAGADTDLWGEIYTDELANLVREGLIAEATVDARVRTVLLAKYRLGLFADPYRYFNEERFRNSVLTPAHRRAARELAEKSMVLLKNEGDLLPLPLDGNRKVAVIGPLLNSRESRDWVGNWGGFVDMNDLITPRQAFAAIPELKGKATYTPGCGNWGRCAPEQIQAAEAAARDADVVLLFVGEHGYHTGEGASKLDITLPGNQEELIQKIAATGKKIVLVVTAGRPLVFTEIIDAVDALLLVWQPGIEAGPAITSVLRGHRNPGGKLTVTLPYAVGQTPLHYAQLPTGRPKLSEEDDRWGISKYGDSPNGGLFPFGFGLSYTEFRYGTTVFSDSLLREGTPIEVRVTVTNTGPVRGTEVVQLYYRDPVASVSRPLRQLLDFRRVELAAGESREISFFLQPEQFWFWDAEMRHTVEPGEFRLFLGGDSQAPPVGSVYY
ncbi:MAG: glycoside hydrolase family 3 N-terminal domain-containing protein, partial [Bacteroidota bacterium]